MYTSNVEDIRMIRDAHHIPCNYTHTHTHTHTQVEDIRMMRDRDGNLRGFCYIDFADETGALAGLSKDKGTL
jgi:RNA recognition motif-containing protein